MREDDDVPGLRFMDDPLVTVSGQFPLSPAEFSVPESSECPLSTNLIYEDHL